MNAIKNRVEKLEKELIEMTNQYHVLYDDWHGKSGEPSITITIDNELNWFGEIYSYVFNFEDGSRHHTFQAKSYEELINKMEEAVKKVKENELKQSLSSEEKT